MRELDRLLISTSVDDLLDLDLESFSEEERRYLLDRVSEIADQKCYQVGIEYNIKDVELVERLDDKLKLIELALTLAYDSKTNYDDVFAQVRMWDALIYNHLKSRSIVIPPIEEHSKDAAYVGAFVKDPILGMHHWVASFDLNSLYPHLIMQYSISPENLIEERKIHERIHQLQESLNIPK